MKHQRTINYDRVYLDFPQLPSIRSITAVPLKTIYYNRSADYYNSYDLIFNTWDKLEDFIERNGIILR